MRLLLLTFLALAAGLWIGAQLMHAIGHLNVTGLLR